MWSSSSRACAPRRSSSRRPHRRSPPPPPRRRLRAARGPLDVRLVVGVHARRQLEDLDPVVAVHRAGAVAQRVVQRDVLRELEHLGLAQPHHPRPGRHLLRLVARLQVDRLAEGGPSHHLVQGVAAVLAEVDDDRLRPAAQRVDRRRHVRRLALEPPQQRRLLQLVVHATAFLGSLACLAAHAVSAILVASGSPGVDSGSQRSMRISSSGGTRPKRRPRCAIVLMYLMRAVSSFEYRPLVARPPWPRC